MAPLVIVFAYPVHGRIIPAMALASRLASHGASIAFLTPSSTTSRAEESLRESKSRNAAASMQIISLDDGKPPSDDAFHLFDRFDILEQRFQEYVASLDELPACVIVDELLSGGLVDAAARSGVTARYVFCPQSALAFAATLYMPLLDSRGCLPLLLSPPPGSEFEEIRIPGIESKPAKPHEFLSVYTDNERITKQMRDCFVRGAAGAKESTGFILNTFEGIELENLEAIRFRSELNPNALPVLPIGPLLTLASGGHDDHPCLGFLNGRVASSVAFISFGTIAKLDVKQTEELAAGIEASGHPFLWILKCQDLDSILPPGFRERTSGRGLVYNGWAPQLQILAHPSTGAFLTHCGWNSTLESIACGVPIIGFPRFMDQHYNLKIAQAARVGVAAAPAIEASDIEKCVKEVFASTEVRRRAAELSQEAKRSIVAADETLAAFVQTLSRTAH